MSKLVIIRGPSGAGKSTVAQALMAAATRPTALIDRDYYMFMFSPEDDARVLDQELLETNILTCLTRGVDVIFEGNFKPATHKALLGKLFEEHPRENFVFYMDASLTETLRRHESRPHRITAAEMANLYDDAVPLGHPQETIIPETSSLEETVELIQQTAGI